MTASDDDTGRARMVVVAIAAVVLLGIRWDGFRALAWEPPILAAALAIWMVKKKQQFAAHMLGAVVLVWLIIGPGLPPVAVSHGVGHTNVRISFVVLDAATERPVERASIQLPEAEFADSPGLRLQAGSGRAIVLRP